MVGETLKLLESNLFLIILVSFLFLGALRLLLEELIAVVKLFRKLKTTWKPKPRIRGHTQD